MTIKILMKTKVQKLPGVKRLYYRFHKVDRVAIDVCTICHANCVYCLHQRNHLAVPKIMRYEVFQKIVTTLAKERFKLIHLYMSGEPFIHPKIYDMMEMVVTLGMESSTATKLNNLLDYTRFDKLLRIATSAHQKVELLITIDSLDNPGAISSGINKDIVRENLSILSKLQRHKSARFIFSSTITRVNEDEIERIKSSLKQYGFNNWQAGHMGYYQSHLASSDDINTIQNFLPLDSRYRDRFEVVDGKIVSVKNSCDFTTPAIDPEGNVIVCCHDMLHTTQLGNVYRSGSMRAILNSPQFRKASQLGKRKALDICRGCN